MLWLYGADHQITEVGAMNIFFLIKKRDGSGNELVTAPLTRGDILAGVTRDSILEMTRAWQSNAGPGAGVVKNMDVSERWLTMGEVLEAHKEGRVRKS